MLLSNLAMEMDELMQCLGIDIFSRMKCNASGWKTLLEISGLRLPHELAIILWSSASAICVHWKSSRKVERSDRAWKLIGDWSNEFLGVDAICYYWKMVVCDGVVIGDEEGPVSLDWREFFCLVCFVLFFFGCLLGCLLGCLFVSFFVFDCFLISVFGFGFVSLYVYFCVWFVSLFVWFLVLFVVSLLALSVCLFLCFDFGIVSLFLC
jgi:hypothetical protein